MTKIIASALLLASALTLSAPAFAQRSYNNAQGAIATNADAGQRLSEQREKAFSSSNAN